MSGYRVSYFLSAYQIKTGQILICEQSVYKTFLIAETFCCASGDYYEQPTLFSDWWWIHKVTFSQAVAGEG